ncbi:GCN5 family acetyltransferase [Mucilaginibacter sp. PAMC 26640]|nr:GCN5 family acetyltransferase [Mucilaginibacter sp. PAMC 26640]
MLSIEQITPYLTWRVRRDVLYPGKYIHDMEMDEDNDGYHFGAFKDNELVAVVSLFAKEHNWQFRKLAVIDKVQNQGVGTELLKYITGFVEQENGKRLWCNARLSAVGFYNKLDFSTAGEVFHKNDIDFIVMQKELISK